MKTFFWSLLQILSNFEMNTIVLFGPHSRIHKIKVFVPPQNLFIPPSHAVLAPGMEGMCVIMKYNTVLPGKAY